MGNFSTEQSCREFEKEVERVAYMKADGRHFEHLL